MLDTCPDCGSDNLVAALIKEKGHDVYECEDCGRWFNENGDPA